MYRKEIYSCNVYISIKKISLENGIIYILKKESEIVMNTVTESKQVAGFFRLILLVLLGLTGIGRLTNHFYSITYTDVLYDVWISTVLGYVLDGLSCLRYVLGFGAVLYAQWKWGNHAGDIIFITAVLCDLVDVGVRFVIDYFTDSIIGMEIMTIIWLLLQFAYDMIILALCWITGRILRMRYQASESVRRDRKYSMARTFRQSLLYVLILRIVIWAIDAVDFISNYSDIQSYEYASMAGQFVFTLVLYGGVAFLLSELVQWWFGRLYGMLEE